METSAENKISGRLVSSMTVVGKKAHSRAYSFGLRFHKHVDCSELTDGKLRLKQQALCHYCLCWNNNSSPQSIQKPLAVVFIYSFNEWIFRAFDFDKWEMIIDQHQFGRRKSNALSFFSHPHTHILSKYCSFSFGCRMVAKIICQIYANIHALAPNFNFYAGKIIEFFFINSLSINGLARDIFPHFFMPLLLLIVVLLCKRSALQQSPFPAWCVCVCHSKLVHFQCW